MDGELDTEPLILLLALPDSLMLADALADPDIEGDTLPD